jgi:hypothetical protein
MESQKMYTGYNYYWTPVDALNYGTFTLALCDVNPGYMTWTAKESKSGHYCQLLSNDNQVFQGEANLYAPGGKYHNSINWAFTRVDAEHFIVRNADMNPGYLTYTAEESGSGHYVQILDANDDTYKAEKSFYEPGGKWFDCLLWKITFENGVFHLRNKALGYGELSYTWSDSKSGKFAQVLKAGNHNYQNDFYSYQFGGKYYSHISWKIERTSETAIDKISNNVFYMSNADITPGYMTYTWRESKSGKYCQLLSNDNQTFVNESNKYTKGNEWNSSVSWSFIRVDANHFIIKNNSINPGFLTYTAEESTSGHYAQILDENDNDYRNDSSHYQPNGKYFDCLLWHVSYDNGYYHIKNKALGYGELSYLYEKSASGYMVQVLKSGNRNYQNDYSHYQKGGKWFSSVSWRLDSA